MPYSFVLRQNCERQGLAFFSLFPIHRYADSTDTVLHFCFDLLLAETACLSLRYSLCPVRKENKLTESLVESWHPFVRNIPGYRVLLSPTSLLGLILPRIPFICRGNNHFFEDKHARTLICTVEQHNWFRCRSLWICWLGCNFHSKISCLLYVPTLDLPDCPGILIPK